MKKTYLLILSLTTILVSAKTPCVSTVTVTSTNGDTFCLWSNFNGSAPGTIVSWQWKCNPTSGVNIQAPNSNNTNISFNAGGNYTVTLLATNNLGFVDSALYSILAYPLPNVIAIGDTVCEGQTIYLTCTPNGAASYAWNGSCAYSSNQQNPVIYSAQPCESGNYVVTVTDTNGCANANIANVLVNSMPDTSVTYIPPDSLTANAVSPTYQWLDCYNNYAAISGATNQTYIGPSNGYFAVIIKDSTGFCADTSRCIFTALSNIKTLSFKNTIYTYPNPASDQFFIDANTTDKLIVDLYDVNGRHVFNANVMDKENIHVVTINNGAYTLTIKTVDRVINKKLVILR